MTPCLCPFTVDRPFLKDTSQRGACASHVLHLLSLIACKAILPVLLVFPSVYYILTILCADILLVPSVHFAITACLRRVTRVSLPFLCCVSLV
jgi:hypothetical protein